MKYNFNDMLSPAFEWIFDNDNVFKNLPIICTNYDKLQSDINSLKSPHIVICATFGDATITKVALNDMVVKLYATNLNVKVERAISLPIGVLEGQAEIITQIQPTPKTKLVYCNFNKNTHCSRRCNIPYPNDFRPSKREDKNQLIQNITYYFNQVVQHKFMICPRGNGIDTYRMWESLYCSTIPIVQRSPFIEYWENLIPIVIVDNFSQLTNDFLNQQYEIINNKTCYLKYLSRKFWIEQIKQEAIKIKK